MIGATTPEQLLVRQYKWKRANEMRANGVEVNHIAVALGVSWRTVDRWLKMKHPPMHLSRLKSDAPPNKKCVECGEACTHKFCSKKCNHKHNSPGRRYDRKCRRCSGISRILGYCFECIDTLTIGECSLCEFRYVVEAGCRRCEAERLEVEKVSAKYGQPGPEDKYWRQNLSYEAFEGW